MEYGAIKKYFVLSLILSLSSGSLLSGQNSQQKNDNIVLLVDDSVTYQTIDHFGASDAWSIQFVGQWPIEKKEAIADLLFSTELDELGNPRGIGLSLWRFNIGAGSAEQGTASGIRDEWRRAESFLEANGTYNWDRQKGQVWFAKAARDRGVEKLLIFSNSPPVHITRNGKAYASNGESNLAPERYNDFSSYLATVTEGLREKGLPVDYISPVNEPQWDWSDGGQEGTPFWNREIAEIVRQIDKELTQRNLSSKIDIPETAQINYLYEQGDKPGRSNQIEEFFTEGSSHYIGDLSQVGHAISGHSYFTTSPFPRSVEQRKELASEVQEVKDLKFWMSEYCILGDNAGEIEGKGRDLGIDPALYMARVIHVDLAIAQASAWHWWLGVSPYDYKDGLVYIDKNKQNGNYYESKMLWALGNYSRFIRPGYQRIKIKDVRGNSPDENFLFSAYKDPGSGEIVVVVINSGDESMAIQLEFNREHARKMQTFTTSAGKNLEFEDKEGHDSLPLPARSVVTITISIH